MRYFREFGCDTERFNVWKKNEYLGSSSMRLRVPWNWRWRLAMRRCEMDVRKCKKPTVPNGKRYHHNIHVRCYNCRNVYFFPGCVVPGQALLMEQKIAGRSVWRSKNMIKPPINYFNLNVKANCRCHVYCIHVGP